MIIELYKNILKYAGLEADAEGYVHIRYGETTKPLQINGLNVVLPTYEQLKTFDGTSKFLFHPLGENILEKGEPLVIKKLKECINIKLNYTIGVVCQSLLSLLLSPELHKQLDQDQSELMTFVSDVDDKVLENFITSMLSKMKKDPGKVFSNIYIKKGGSLRGKKFSRLAVIMFPFYEELQDSKLRKKDKLALKRLLEYIFSGIVDDDEYKYGTTSRVAPYLDALMMGSMKLAGELNDIVSSFSNFIDEPDSVMFEAGWYDSFADLEALLPEIRKIPAHGIQEVAEVAVAPTPVPHVAPAPLTASHLAPAPVAPVSAPALVKTKDGLDFSSIMQVNPALAYIPNPLANIAAQENHVKALQQAQAQPAPVYDPRTGQYVYPQQATPPPPIYPAPAPMYPQSPVMQPQPAYPHPQPAYPYPQAVRPRASY